MMYWRLFSLLPVVDPSNYWELTRREEGNTVFHWLLEEYLSLPWLLIRLLVSNLNDRSRWPVRRLQYGRSPSQSMHVFEPAGHHIKDSLIFFLPGGAWCFGHPLFFQFIGRHFASKGYKTVIAGDRPAPFHHLASQTEDVLDALAYAFELAGNRKMAVIGQSSGAHLAALAVLDRKALSRRGLSQKAIAALIAISGPLDLSRLNNGATRRVIHAVMGRTPWGQGDPIRLVRGDEPFHVLSIHGSRDPMVDLACSRSFVDRFNQNNKGQAALVLAPGLHHADLVTIFMGNGRIAQAMDHWLEQHSP